MMDAERLKKSVMGIKAPDEMKARLVQTALQGHAGQASHEKRNKRMFRRGSAVLLAAVLVLSLSVVAFAASSGDWFAAFFSARSEGELSPDQQLFIQNQSVGIGQRATVDDYTVLIESAICDTQNLYLVIRVEGPEEVILDLDPAEGSLYFGSVKSESTGTYERTGHLVSRRTTWYQLDDGDGKGNTETLLMREQRVMSADSNDIYTDGEVWRFRFSRLLTRTGDLFENETMLAEGEWIFEFPLTEMSEEREMISSPVVCTAQSGGEGTTKEDEEIIKENAEILVTSFVLRPFGATCQYSFIPGSTPDAVDILDAYLVMKDGSEIWLKPSSATGGVGALGHAGGTMSYVLDAPLMLDNVAYLVLPENVMIQYPEEG